MRRHLYWRIYLTLLASLALTALISAGFWRLSHEPGARPFGEPVARALGALLPPVDAPAAEQARALERLASALRGTIVMTARDGGVIARAGDLPEAGRWRDWTIELADGRALRLIHGPHHVFSAGDGGGRVVLFLLATAIAVGIAAHPVVRRLTRRLERLRGGVEAWGTGRLGARAPVEGSDEIAAVARSFNAAAARVEGLIGAHKTLLANASHELRSPLARLRLAIEMQEAGPDPARKAEIERSLAELDALVDEVLLASRLDQADATLKRERVDLLALAAEEAARVGAAVDGTPCEIDGDPRLLRRLIRNLLENAARHGAPPIEIEIARAPSGGVGLAVQDRGKGIPDTERARVFEPFYRPAGASETGGSWGLGLALVRQIAERHGGAVRCEPRHGGGTSFIVELPAPPGPGAGAPRDSA